MRILETSLPGVLLFEPKRFGDDRGFFVETFRERRYRDAGVRDRFVQDNLSHSTRNVLRGLHFQKGQAKLVTVVRGEVFDVAVDIRPDSDHFGRWFGTCLSAANHRQLFIPSGFAHGFCVLSDKADVWYKTTREYRPEDEGGIVWDDPAIGIKWPAANPVLSERDRANPLLEQLERAALMTCR